MDDIENRSQGWVLIHRSLFDKGLDSETIHLWLYLISSANIKETNYNLIKIMRGQLLTGRDKLEMNTGINQSKIERILKYFESEQQIEQQKTNKYRIITIKNYDSYQNMNNKMNNSQQQPTTDQQQTNNKKHIINNINKDNKVNKDKEEKEIDKFNNLSLKKVFKIPTVEEVRKHCMERGNTVPVEQFHSFYESNGWKVGKNPMRSWQAAIITWEKNYPKNEPYKPTEDELKYSMLYRKD